MAILLERQKEEIQLMAIVIVVVLHGVVVVDEVG